MYAIDNQHRHYSQTKAAEALRDFRWLGRGKYRDVALMALKSEMLAVIGFFDYEHKTHFPESDRLSRDSQHRVWNGYGWEIL